MKIDNRTFTFHLLRFPIYILRIVWGCVKYPILFLDWILPEVNTSNRRSNQGRRHRRERPVRLRPTLMDVMISLHYNREYRKRRKPELFNNNRIS